MISIKEEALRNMFHAAAGIEAFLRFQSQPTPISPALSLPRPTPAATQGRNDPCACGSGRKFKHCCAKSG